MLVQSMAGGEHLVYGVHVPLLVEGVFDQEVVFVTILCLLMEDKLAEDLLLKQRIVALILVQPTVAGEHLVYGVHVLLLVEVVFDQEDVFATIPRLLMGENLVWDLLLKQRDAALSFVLIGPVCIRNQFMRP